MKNQYDKVAIVKKRFKKRLFLSRIQRFDNQKRQVYKAA